MTPKKMEALQMLNVAFASHDVAPVDQAIITKADFRLLFEALTEKPSAAPEGTLPSYGRRELTTTRVKRNVVEVPVFNFNDGESVEVMITPSAPLPQK